jgi:proteic killer suppression protein
MITSFRHKGLSLYFASGDKRAIPAQSAARIGRILDRLEASIQPDDMDLPGYKFHPLKGDRAGEYAVTVTGNMRITYRFNGSNAEAVNLEDYH